MALTQRNLLDIAKGQRTAGSTEEDFSPHGYAEIDFGTRPVGEITVTIYDNRVRTGTRIIAHQLYEAATDKELDESIMDTLILIAGNARAESFELVARASDGSYLEGAFLIGYTLINNDEAAEVSDDMLIESDEY